LLVANFAQCPGIESEKVENALVERAVVVIFPARSSDFGAAFVEHTWQKHVAAEALARTARRTLCQIRRGDFVIVRHVFSLSLG
jgi:hypothetical protein